MKMSTVEMTEEKVKELIEKAILKERKRIANIIYNFSPCYSSNYDDSPSTFDWYRTVEKLRKEIMAIRSEDYEEESKD